MILFWDIDDVLNDLTDELFRVHFGEALSTGSYTLPHQAFLDHGWDYRKYLNALDAFRRAQYSLLLPKEPVSNFMESTPSVVRHVALTAVPDKFASISARWVLENYEGLIQGVLIVPSRRSRECPGAWTTKAECIRSFGQPSILVDDDPRNLLDIPTSCLPRQFPAKWAGWHSASAVPELLATLKDDVEGSL